VATGRDAWSRTDQGSAALTPAGFRAMVEDPGAGGGLMICYVDLEHPELGPSMLSERPNATERPLFAGLDETVVVEQRHFWELKTAPVGFVRLAASDACPIQAIRHGGRPLYGVQFHPERYSERHPDGRIILSNFFRLAGFPAPRSEAAALARA
jgi:hypothetical protein